MVLFRTEHRQILKFNYSEHEEYAGLLSSIGTLLERQVAPSSPDFDSKTKTIQSARKTLLDNGIVQIAYPAQYGGLGLPFGVYDLAMELLGAADASIALSIGIHNTAAEGLSQFGSEALKKEFLADIIAGRRLASFSLTEPTSGSDAKAMNTRAKKSGGEYVLNGSKMYITNAGEADIYFVFATTEKGPSSFLVEKTVPGIQFGGDIAKLGMRGSRTSEVRFTDCKVPREMLVGEEGKGFDYAKAMLNGSRIVMGSICVGIAQASFDKALAYSKQRKAFGSAISEFQLTQEKIADMKTGITAGRLLCMHAARLRESRADFSSEASQAKVFSTEMSLRVCDAAIQIFGGYGYTTDDIHRHWRDARLLTIGEGTSEVLRLLIARKELARSL
ncbi:MAG: acyl-CoA dehydrogenase family protein [Nitrososphaerales archaeon]|nr:acyl-CoA dehydrogenase family protein [Nitrososphaerales archaeon]